MDAVVESGTIGPVAGVVTGIRTSNNKRPATRRSIGDFFPKVMPPPPGADCLRQEVFSLNDDESVRRLEYAVPTAVGRGRLHVELTGDIELVGGCCLAAVDLGRCAVAPADVPAVRRRITGQVDRDLFATFDRRLPANRCSKHLPRLKQFDLLRGEPLKPPGTDRLGLGRISATARAKSPKLAS